MLRTSLLTLAVGAAAGAHAEVTLCGQYGDYETKAYTCSYHNSFATSAATDIAL